VFCWDDISSFPALYLRYAEGYRPQIEVYDRATRLTALSAQLHASFGIETNDYQSARLSFCQQSLGDKHLVKCHYVYNEAWLNSPNKLYSNGILYSSIPPAKPITIPDIPLEYKINDFKTRQLLVNLALCQGEEYLLESPSDSLRAMVFFHKAMRLMESEPRAALHNQMGIFFRHFKFFDLALKCYANARNCPRLNKQEQKDLNFNISNIYKDKGNLSFAQGEYVNAVDNYSKALKYDPNNARLYYNIGVILIKNMHLPEKGLPYLKSYLKLNPSDAKTKEFINLYRKL
jgi:tetratricopeptide (TPR) repeat protein